MMFKAVVVCVAALWAGAAYAADQPVYSPVPAWVKPVTIPAATADGADGAPVQVLLANNQARFGADGDQFYQEYAAKILAPQGLSVAGSIAQNWNPDTDTLFIHKLNIIRDGKVIDILAGGQKFIILRRENQLEQAMLDGTLTATIQPEGLEVGDIVDFAATVLKRDPVLQGRSEGFEGMRFPGVVRRVFIRETWPDDKHIQWKVTEGLGTPVLTHGPDGSELTVDLTDIRAPKPPLGAPARFKNLAELQLTQFSDWSEVSALMAPFYATAAQLAPDSPVRAEVAKIAAATSDPKQRAAMALHLVQDRTRYVFLGMNFGGYIPAAADRTWARRFGDCKGKTALLLAVLHELGIQAQPALIATKMGDGLDERLPALSMFDHVMVRATIGGKVYWLDGTREGDRGLDDLTVPNFHWALPLQATGGRLEKLVPQQVTVPDTDSVLTLNASAGLDAPAPAHQDGIYHGDAAIGMNLKLRSVTREDAERYLREFWNHTYPWIKINKVDFVYDPAAGTERISMDGLATMAWARNGSFRDFDISQSGMGSPNASFRREPGPHQDAPYAVDYPSFNRTKVLIILPNKGEGFVVRGGADIDRTVGGIEFHRHSSLENGVVTMEVSDKAIEPEFPASEADAAGAALRDMARADVVVRALINDGSAYASGGAQPSSATDFGIRGAQAMRAGDLETALADFDRAAKLEPREERWVYDRAVAHLAKRQDDLALADLSQALILNPADPAALMARGELYGRRGNLALADQDFNAAAKVAPDDASYALRRTAVYANNHQVEAAVAGLGRFIDAHPNTPLAYALYNQRCWVRAMSNTRLDLALADCNTALSLKPDFAAALDSRGFVNLRLGRLNAAIADYTAALNLNPRIAESLYGRGLAKARNRMAAEADADIAAATAIDPKVAAEFASYGVTR